VAWAESYQWHLDPSSRLATIDTYESKSGFCCAHFWETVCLPQLINCTDDITHWFLENGLLLNPSKTEAVVFGTASRLRSADTTGGVKVAGTSLEFLQRAAMLALHRKKALY